MTDLGNQFRPARRKAQLSEALVLYCARHDYGTRVLTNTGNLAAVMKTMRHKDVRAAIQYQHPELDCSIGPESIKRIDDYTTSRHLFALSPWCKLKTRKFTSWNQRFWVDV